MAIGTLAPTMNAAAGPDAAEEGSRVWRKLVRNPPVGAEEEPGSSSSLALAGPNPADGRVTLRITAPPGRARVEIFDALGRVVATPFDAETDGGASRIVGFDTAGLAAGAYVARLQTTQGASSVRFSVVR